MVIQQSQEKLKKLTATADEIMQSGISLAEDLIVSPKVLVGRFTKLKHTVVDHCVTHNKQIAGGGR